jgi:hypothetical protein
MRYLVACAAPPAPDALPAAVPLVQSEPAASAATPTPLPSVVAALLVAAAAAAEGGDKENLRSVTPVGTATSQRRSPSSALKSPSPNGEGWRERQRAAAAAGPRTSTAAMLSRMQSLMHATVNAP